MQNLFFLVKGIMSNNISEEYMVDYGFSTAIEFSSCKSMVNPFTLEHSILNGTKLELRHSEAGLYTKPRQSDLPPLPTAHLPNVNL